MMLLFRSTFITAVSALVVALCMFSMSASASPQFGRPFFHVLDATTVSESMLPSASYLAPIPNSTPLTSASGDLDPDPQIAEVPSSTSTFSASSTAEATQAVVNTGTSTSGAQKSLYGGMSIMFGVAMSAVWLAL